MSEIQVLRQFRCQLISFFEELISQFPEEPDLVILHIFFSNQIPIKEVIEYFIHRLSINMENSAKQKTNLREMIQNRNEEFFLQSNSVFHELSKTKVNHFKRLWRSGRLDDEDKDVIWKWIDSFVYLVDKYQKIMEAC